MKITIRGRVSKENEELERRQASSQRNVYYLKIEPEEGFGRPQHDRIEITHGGITYRLEFDEAGLILGGYDEQNLPIGHLTADAQSANAVIIRGTV